MLLIEIALAQMHHKSHSVRNARNVHNRIHSLVTTKRRVMCPPHRLQAPQLSINTITGTSLQRCHLQQLQGTRASSLVSNDRKAIPRNIIPVLDHSSPGAYLKRRVSRGLELAKMKLLVMIAAVLGERRHCSRISGIVSENLQPNGVAHLAITTIRISLRSSLMLTTTPSLYLVWRQTEHTIGKSPELASCLVSKASKAERDSRCLHLHVRTTQGPTRRWRIRGHLDSILT